MVSVSAFLLAAVSAYLLGSIPTGFLMTKIFTGVDIRNAGSKNVGATNVYRIGGKLAGLLTLFIDIGKGVLAATVVANFYYSFIMNIDYVFFKAFLGLISIFGHVWSVFLKLKGGKGVATTIGVTAVLAPIPLLISLLVWLAIFIPTNYVSLGSLAFGISLPICAAILNESFYVVIFCVIICLLNTYKHKENIKRLIKRVENKTMLFRK
ncbi:MAG: acyl-phosphate glycerol 3-phosphate acyltransferase [Omnitrophica bacterium RIFCSPLOWO2_02_FULL_45_16]|nr:MAG: acyl-phosphate glycerol 3-phosphate acyltransferase [Omnitrophica bacterium RIFCSPHIGHO2_02_FULL_46_20]OGW92530.1 MAG: acyl-phosphate glycerol 3-phosphate acyltransferase [Omnitrophica bacterium RIFCSPLOWO2_12_FULL_45_13]OGX00320.1 MAG: acyl-phosphate glycerol 3-phosphate acyltransferase [Omnitrophica bacterium RIFCSPLOWO2_02_FULL_45_16]